MESRFSPISLATNQTIADPLLRPKRLLSLIAGMGLLLCSHSLLSQNGLNNPPRPTGILLPEANRPPDANEQMRMKESSQRKQNFDAANALRQKQIDDESTKLLILANDLKQQIDKLGNKPLSDRMVREAEVIELLAHDVQAKMTMTVGGG